MTNKDIVTALLGVLVVILLANLVYFKYVDLVDQLAKCNVSTTDHNIRLTRLSGKLDELDKKFGEVYQIVSDIQTQSQEMHQNQSEMRIILNTLNDIDNKYYDLNGEFAQMRGKISALTQCVPQSKKDVDTSASINAIIDHEKLHNFLAMRNVPADVRNWFTYSETEAAKLSQLSADHPLVIDHIRKFKLIPPPHSYLRKKHEVKDYSRGNAQHLIHIFKNKSSGFFVECGAFDGLWLSNTMYLEQLLGWTGVMIEAEPNNFEEAVQKTRNVHLVPGCLSITTRPMLVNFTFGDHVYSKINAEAGTANVLPVQCFPLHSILLALGRTSVDFFSLDIEGNELDVLKTVPFDQIDIKVLVVEFKFIKGGKKALADFMLSKGYVIYPSLPEEETFQKWAEDDYIFVKKGSGYRETRPEATPKP